MTRCPRDYCKGSYKLDADGDVRCTLCARPRDVIVPLDIPREYPVSVPTQRQLELIREELSA